MTLLKVLDGADTEGDVFFLEEPDTVALVLEGSANETKVRFRDPDGDWHDRSSWSSIPVALTLQLASGFYRVNCAGGDVRAFVELAIPTHYGVICIYPPTAPVLRGFPRPGESGDVSLEWSGSESDVHAPIEKYQRRIRQPGGAFGAWNDISVGTDPLSGTYVTNLAVGSTYGFQVRAVNLAGEGAVSNTVEVTVE